MSTQPQAVTVTRRGPVRTLAQFEARVVADNLTLDEVRFNVPPSPAVMALLEDAGDAAYERFATRYTAKLAK